METTYAPITCIPGYRALHTRSLEANKSPGNICRLPRRAENLRHQVTDKVQAPILRDIPAEVPAQMITMKPQPQPRLHMFPAGRDVSIHKSLHYNEECPTIARVPEARDTNDRCISEPLHFKGFTIHILLKCLCSTKSVFRHAWQHMSCKCVARTLKLYPTLRMDVTSCVSIMHASILTASFVLMLYTRAFQPAALGPHAAREAILCGPRSHTFE